jgi:hypothetical protein
MTINGKSSVSRRAVVGATATAALGGAASLAHASMQGSETMNEQGLQNPADRYPKPPTRDSRKKGPAWPAR